MDTTQTAGEALITPVEEEPPSSPSSRASVSSVAGPAVLSPTEIEFVDLLLTRSAVPRKTGLNTPSQCFRKAFFKGVTPKEWSDWRWHLRNRIRSLAQLERFIRLAPEEREAMDRSGGLLPLSITPYYLHLVSPEDPRQPLRRTVIPVKDEYIRSLGEADDPLGEDHQSPVPGLVHRYPDRVLLLAMDFCSTYCRYCTRSRVVGHGKLTASEDRLEQAVEYIREHGEIRDVLISGGDPLLLGDEKLDWLLTQLRAIKHVELLRLGTKVPAVLPQRITGDLVRIFRKHHPLWMSLHFTHPDECTPESRKACERLADAGIPLGSQTVLLKGVNDDAAVMKELVHRLLRMRVRPYYLYQCDPISGSRHFRTSVAKGLEIIAALRGHTSGYAVPHYVIDAPGGGGKIALLPESVVGREGQDLLLRNFEGKVFRYPDPLGAMVPKAVEASCF